MFTLLAHWLRGYRWGMLIEKTGTEARSSNLYHAVMSGYFANLAIPRLGEFVRCGAVQKTEGISYNKLLGTVIGERVVDILLLLFLLFLAVLLHGMKIGEFIYYELVQTV